MSQEIAIALIVPGSNHRKRFDQRKLNLLAKSIEKNGLVEPVVVRPSGTGWQLIAGERRLRACRDILKWTMIPAEVKEADDRRAGAIMRTENMCRVDPNPMEEASAYQMGLEQGCTVEELAEETGVTLNRVTSYLQLLTLVPEAQQLVETSNLSVSFALKLVPLDANRQRIALRVLAASNSVSAGRWANITGQLFTEQAQDALPGLEMLLIEQAESLNRTFVPTGKQAHTGAPATPHLPPVRYDPGDRMAHIFDRYIADLLDAGCKREADGAAAIYNALVALSRVSLPEELTLNSSPLPVEESVVLSKWFKPGRS